MSAKLRLRKLEAALARLPRRRCRTCAQWGDYPVEYRNDWRPPEQQRPSPWPPGYRCPGCGRTPVHVIVVEYVENWRTADAPTH